MNRRRHILGLLVLALILSGCWVQVLENPADPQWDSEEIARAYSLQSDLLLVAVFLIPGAIGGAVMLALSGRRK
jgi:hypothetical protein